MGTPRECPLNAAIDTSDSRQTTPKAVWKAGERDAYISGRGPAKEDIEVFWGKKDEGPYYAYFNGIEKTGSIWEIFNWR